jgi:hypothetical protein
MEEQNDTTTSNKMAILYTSTVVLIPGYKIAIVFPVTLSLFIEKPEYYDSVVEGVSATIYFLSVKWHILPAKFFTHFDLHFVPPRSRDWKL